MSKIGYGSKKNLYFSVVKKILVCVFKYKLLDVYWVIINFFFIVVLELVVFYLNDLV